MNSRDLLLTCFLEKVVPDAGFGSRTTFKLNLLVSLLDSKSVFENKLFLEAAIKFDFTILMIGFVVKGPPFLQVIDGFVWFCMYSDVTKMYGQYKRFHD